MKNLNKNQIIIIVVVGLIIITTIGIYFYKMVLNKDDYIEENVNLESNFINNENEESTINKNKITVHITGAVNDKGIVILDEGARIIDAIDATGGETDDADLNKLNLAYVLQDGEKLYVPFKNENKVEEYTSVDSGENVIIEGSGSSNSKKNDIININTATKEELETLTGIGESTANKIIKYREENGKFNVIDDIKNVPGIGDAKFENIKDKITVK